MEHEKSYVYKPSGSKRRRLDPPASPLDTSRELRESIYRELWSSQQQRIQTVLDDANRVTLDEVLSFLKESRDSSQSKDIKTGFILAGPDTTSHGTFFEQFQQQIETETSNCIAILNSSDGPNLKAVLKNLIRNAAENNDNLVSQNGVRLLDYDLQLLHQWMLKNGKDCAVVAVQDSEAFDAHVLGDLIELMRYAGSVKFNCIL